jgi:uncharacterized protein YajQ (UPF0234 family)
MPSLDIVSQFDKAEVENAFEQAKKEIAQRFDFRGTNTTFERTEEEFVIRSSSEEKIKAALEVLYGRLTKRGVSITFLDEQKIEGMGHAQVRQTIKLKQGISQEKAKKIQVIIRDSKLKVQASIQGDAVRVTGKQRDDLQEVMALMRKQDLGMVVQFINFRE